MLCYASQVKSGQVKSCYATRFMICPGAPRAFFFESDLRLEIRLLKIAACLPWTCWALLLGPWTCWAWLGGLE